MSRIKLKYYIVVEEWNYPNETGREYRGMFDDINDALDACEVMANSEHGNYERACRTDPRPVEMTVKIRKKVPIPTGCMITARNGLDEWFYAARIIEVERL